MLNILVTGSKGQLGCQINELSTIYKHTFFFSDKDILDITNLYELEKFIEQNNIHVIINCAAYTAVQKAQSNEEAANETNHIGAKNLANISKKRGIKLIHISTDYVFDGRAYMPYKEDDIANPKTVYGKTKLDGERAILNLNPKNSTIIRASWIYSAYGDNFVKTMLRLGEEKGHLDVIYDQIGAPTYAGDLVKIILDIFLHVENENAQIYHYSNEGVLSWYDFAKEIMRMAKLTCKINPIETKDYPSSVDRPYYSLLNKSKIKESFGIEIPYWKDSLDKCLREMDRR